MLVAVDLGNSAIKFGAFDGGRLVAVERVEAGRSLAEDVIPPPHLFLASEVVVLASAPRRIAEFESWCPVPVRVVGDEARAAFESTYEHPSELGLDRIAAALGARSRCPGRAVVIVDAGTAITVDALTADGRFLPLAIAPGPRAAADGLHAAAPHLPFPDLAPGAVGRPARGTADSLRAGHVLGMAGLVDRLVREAAGLAGADATVLLCGGAAELLAPHIETRFRCEPDLVLVGIASMAGAV